MEINIKEPIHIEFYGLPGCGKSVVSHMVAKQLRKQGIKVYEPSYDSDHNLNPTSRRLYKLWTTIFFCIANYKDYQILRQLTKENGYVKFRDSIKQIANIVPKIVYYRKSESAIYIWDEGLVQSAISIALNSNVDIKEVVDKLFYIVKKRESKKVYLKTDIKTALRRMAGRDNNDSRVEKELDERKKLEMMKHFEKCCNQVDHNVIEIKCDYISIEMLSIYVENRILAAI